jgi:cytochrome c biogenesis protein CcmG, thiol:disulfide interchange protein DsbE
MRRFLIPLLAFIVLIGFLAAGLTLKPREVPSPLVGKPVPTFKLPELNNTNNAVGPDDFKGQVWLLNVWASWCVSCRQEHPVLLALEKQHRITLVGLNYKDQQGDAIEWLRAHGGNPYKVSAMDADGRVGINLGVYGVPETFLIDKKGIIRHKHIGPVTAEALEKTILPMAQALYLEH